MRASEFIIETRTLAKPTKRQQNASVGMSKFRDPGGYDRTYELNRIMMATACADGTTPLDIDAESWSGRYNTAHPYTKIEFVVNDLNVSRLTAANYLNKLAEDGLLKKAKLGTGTYYINEPLFELLSNR